MEFIYVYISVKILFYKILNSGNTNQTDNELLYNFYSDHDNKWLGMLLPRYTLLLFGVCMKYLKNEDDAKDSVQQIFLKVINELHKYKVDYFKSWIYMIAKNHCLMKLREKGKYTVEISDNIKAVEITVDKNQLLENENTILQMQEALHRLNNEQQQCITLFYLQKKSYSQIAEQTGLNMMQVKSNIQNGKRNLRLALEKKIS